MHEGWYLMSAADVELELRRWRAPDAAVPPSNALALTIEDALAYRNAGNLPDDLDRSLRLVLHVKDAAELTYLQQKRLDFEPDFHDAPSWRTEGSRPVNVVPLRDPGAKAEPRDAWWDDPDIAALEKEWRATGRVAGIEIPGEYRSFVYKTVLSLLAAGRDVTVDSLLASIARWLPPQELEILARALKQGMDPSAGG